MTETVAKGSEFIIYVAIGLAIYFWGYARFRADRLEYKLGLIQKDLKERNLKEGADDLRKVLYSVIDILQHHSHILGFWPWLASLLLPQSQSSQMGQQFQTLERDIAALQEPEEREFLEKAHDRILTTLFLHILFGTPVLLVLFVGYALFQVLGGIVKKTLSITPPIPQRMPMPAGALGGIFITPGWFHGV